MVPGATKRIPLPLYFALSTWTKIFHTAFQHELKSMNILLGCGSKLVILIFGSLGHVHKLSISDLQKKFSSSFECQSIIGDLCTYMNLDIFSSIWNVCGLGRSGSAVAECREWLWVAIFCLSSWWLAASPAICERNLRSVNAEEGSLQLRTEKFICCFFHISVLQFCLQQNELNPEAFPASNWQNCLNCALWAK